MISERRERLRQIGKWAWILGTALLWALRLVAFLLASTPSQGDFASYLAAATALRLNPHANIYDLSVIVPYGCGYLQRSHSPYVYPPLLALLLIPFTYLPCQTALVIWAGINVVVWLLAVVSLLRYLPRLRWLVFPLGLFFAPMFSAFFYGQIDIVVLLGILATLWLVEREKPRWAGIVLGGLTAIKLFPALLVLYFVGRRKWSVGLSSLATVAVSVVVMTAVVGIQGMRESAQAILAFHRITDHYPENIALFPLSPYLPPLLLGLAVIFFVTIWRYQDGDLRLGYGWGLCTMMLVLPVIWQRYFVWLLPVFAYILSRRPSRAVTLTLGGIFALIAVLSLYSPILTLLTVVPLWVVAGWTFTHSSQRARREGGKVLAAIRQRIRGARRGARVGARADRASELATPPPRFIPE